MRALGLFVLFTAISALAQDTAKPPAATPPADPAAQSAFTPPVRTVTVERAADLPTLKAPGTSSRTCSIPLVQAPTPGEKDFTMPKVDPSPNKTVPMPQTQGAPSCDSSLNSVKTPAPFNFQHGVTIERVPDSNPNSPSPNEKPTN